MSTNIDIFRRTDEIFAAILPDLQRIDWLRYGSKFTPVDPVLSVKRYQGFKVMMVPVGGWVCVNTFGDLPDPQSNERAVVGKIAVLRDDAHAVASIMRRYPPHVWGGAIESYDNARWGMSGLPEIADHILITLVVNYAYEHQDRALTNRLLSFRLPGVSAAAAEKGMTEAQYNKLVSDLEDLVLGAARLVR